MTHPFTPKVNRRPLAPLSSAALNRVSTPPSPTPLGGAHKTSKGSLVPTSRSSVPVQKPTSKIPLSARHPKQDENDMAGLLQKEKMRRQLAEAALADEKRVHAETRRQLDAQRAQHAPQLDELKKLTEAHDALLDEQISTVYELSEADSKLFEKDARNKELLRHVSELKEQQRLDQELISHVEIKAEKAEDDRAALAIKCARLEAERDHKVFGR
ncbi:uncharacterized protein LOC62_07G008926 [Vanrija pseudolonga]|uniref:Uncharacterized protein n=1 Tax=Vanrija pseudolonga TaxID=143232 RepID=A0AAF0YH03_9TREE|nr:hypothetical protein LOC62_07G008926 [Vanrija pseudolonga]